uniref:Uncharacterized protein n=2 Tax=Leersia perrieri TaxID=77586 RepID=A0A0D9W8H8_9ORYZ
MTLLAYSPEISGVLVLSSRPSATERNQLKQRSSVPMGGAARFILENVTRQIKPVNGLPRLMTITTPQKHGMENNSNESVLAKDENTEPLVAFSRPPPLPPVLGPLIVLSLFNTSSGGDEDKKQTELAGLAGASWSQPASRTGRNNRTAERPLPCPATSLASSSC